MELNPKPQTPNPKLKTRSDSVAKLPQVAKATRPKQSSNASEQIQFTIHHLPAAASHKVWQAGSKFTILEKSSQRISIPKMVQIFKEIALATLSPSMAAETIPPA